MEAGIPTIEELRHVSFIGQAAPTRRCVCGAGRRSSPAVNKSSTLPDTSQSPESDEFLAWLLGRAGLDGGVYRGKPLQRRLSACLRALRASTTQEARMLLEQRPELLPHAISAILLGVTEFFRDAPVFECLKTVILPAVSPRQGGLKIWSTACSEGPELYSIAILLAEANLLDQCHLLGTDCRPDAIQRARAGLYGAAAVRTVEPRLLGRYFEPQGAGVRVLPVLRNRLSWIVKDMFAPPGKGLWDIILWRNVAIYLKAAAASRMWSELCRVLAPGGFLVVGKAERPDNALPLRRIRACVYRKAGG